MKVEKRISRIEELMRRLEAGDRVSQGSLKRVLSTDHFAQLSDEKGSSKEPKPVEIERYETLLRRCLRLCQKHEEGRSELSEERSAKLREKAQEKLEETHLYACGLIREKPTLREWFDRDPATADSGNPESFPRIVSQSAPKRGRKLEVLGVALKNLKDESAASQPEPEAPVEA